MRFDRVLEVLAEEEEVTDLQDQKVIKKTSPVQVMIINPVFINKGDTGMPGAPGQIGEPVNK